MKAVQRIAFAYSKLVFLHIVSVEELNKDEFKLYCHILFRIYYLTLKTKKEMKSKIYNPYVNVEGYNCFGCSMDNHEGLKMQFVEDGEYIISQWQPNRQFEGWMNVLHGGIQATLLDEIGNWIVFVKLQTAGVTAELTVQYKRSVKITNKPITLRAKLREFKFNIAFIDAELIDHEGNVCSKAQMKYFTFNEEKAKNEFLYPGINKFYAENKQ